MPRLNSLSKALLTIFDLWLDFLSFIRLSLQPRSALAAENLFDDKVDAFVEAAIADGELDFQGRGSSRDLKALTGKELGSLP